jgi:hypothetical protein
VLGTINRDTSTSAPYGNGLVDIGNVVVSIFGWGGRPTASSHRDAMMRILAKTRTTLTIDEELLRAVKVRAARTGKGDSEVIEEALRRDLGFDVLDRLWARNEMTEEEAQGLALEAQRAARRRRR